MSDPNEPTPRVMVEEPPPLLGTWRRIYIIVVCYLAFLVALFYFFTRAFDS